MSNGIDSLLDSEVIKFNRLPLPGFEINRPHAVGAENWEVIMYMFWDKHFAAADILLTFHHIFFFKVSQTGCLGNDYDVTEDDDFL